MKQYGIFITLALTLIMAVSTGNAEERRPTGAEVRRIIDQADRLASRNNLQEAEALLNPIFNNAWEMRETGLRLIRIYHAQAEYLKERVIWGVLKTTYPNIPEYRLGYLETLFVTKDLKRLRIELNTPKAKHDETLAELRKKMEELPEPEAEPVIAITAHPRNTPSTQAPHNATTSTAQPQAVKTPVAPSEEKSPFFRARFSGAINLFGAVYNKHHLHSSEKMYGDLYLLPKLSLSAGDDVLFYLQGKFGLDSEQYGHGVGAIPDRTGKVRLAELHEGYLEWNNSPFRLRSGQQIFDWSMTDTTSVADNLNPRDWNDLIRWERVGVPSLDLRVGGDSFIQAVYSPWFIPSRLPANGQRWSPPPQAGVTATAQGLPTTGNGQWGMRTGTVLNGFDLGANAYLGYNFSPAARVTDTSATSVFLTSYYRRMEVYGVSAAKEVYGYNLRLESGYFHQHGGDRFMQYIGGIDREWGNTIRQTDSLYLLLQYADESLLSRGSRPLLFDFRRVFAKNIMGKLKYSLDDTREWSFKLEGIYNLRDRDFFIEPALIWNRFGVTIEAGVDILDGGSDTFWGTYRNNSRMFLKGTYLF